MKVVPVAPKPENYKYGEVSGDATPALIAGSVLVVALAALVPGFLSAGESAKKQQGEFEVKNKIGVNEFAIKARQEKNKNAPEVKAAPKKK